MELQSSFQVMALALCAFAFLVIRGDKQTLIKPPFFLIAYLLLECAGFTFSYLMEQPEMPVQALWLGLLMVSSFLVAPCLYLLAQEVMQKQRPAIPSLFSKHGMIVLLAFTFTLPLLSSIYLNLALDGVSEGFSLFIHTSMLICVGLFSLQVPYYIHKTRDLMRAGKLSEKQSSANSILNLLIVLVATNWLMNMCRAFDCLILKTSSAAFTLIEVSITVWALVLIVRKQSDTQIIHTVHEEKTTGRKYLRSGLDEAAIVRIADKLNLAAAQDHIFQNNALTLQLLGKHINEKPHYVSQTLNQRFDCNFFEWINQQRIEFAKHQLLIHPSKTILDIAMDAGFNSKSTFNTAFKRYVGQTPSQLRQAATQHDLRCSLNSG